ncbi:MAG: hypothetical protein KAU01_01275, partial [Candidatus Cloacimonetes bacterium]|nr:hypothetical protein [Candidatus Cloacimonadota bacterium]
ILLLASFIFLSAYERDQVSRYAHRYTRLTEGKNYAVNISPDSMYYNVNPFIISLEGGTGYHPDADCAHFVSQCLQAGGIPMYEDGYNDNSSYLGIVNCKNLHTLADSLFPVREDWYHTTFQDSFWMEETLDPFLESNHFPYQFSYDGLNLCSDIYFLKIFFSHIDVYFCDNINVTLPHSNVYPIYGFHYDFWTALLSNYYNNEYDPITYASISLQENPPYGNNNYGYRADGLKWTAHYEPATDYTTGDFQIYCNYRTDNINFNNNYEFFYENDYNDTGRTIRYRHTAICRSGSGSSAHVSAHDNDRNDSLWSYAYCDGSEVYNWLALNSITFYNVNINGNRPNLTRYNEWGSKSIITTSDPDSTNDKDYFEIGDPVYIKYSFQNDDYVMIPDRFQVRVEFENSRTLIDSILYDGIFADSIIIQNVAQYFNMPELDSLTINVKLDDGSGQDYGDDWERTWNDQNWQETNETDNIISKTLYLNTGLQPPTNVHIEVNTGRNDLQIQWEGNPSSSYKVYSSNNPYSGFVEDLTGTYSTNSWSTPLPTENRFYYVVETDERHDRKSNILHFKKKGK